MSGYRNTEKVASGQGWATFSFALYQTQIEVSKQPKLQMQSLKILFDTSDSWHHPLSRGLAAHPAILFCCTDTLYHISVTICPLPVADHYYEII